MDKYDENYFDQDDDWVGWKTDWFLLPWWEGWWFLWWRSHDFVNTIIRSRFGESPPVNEGSHDDEHDDEYDGDDGSIDVCLNPIFEPCLFS